MSFDPVPWFVGGGAQHSPEIARLLAYAAFGGAEGVVGPGDLKVATLASPGASVRVLPGACSILNRSGQYESYAARLVSEDVLPIGATGGSARSDLIVARIEDPFAYGTPWADPADPTVGPYVFTRVIAGVPAGTTNVASLGLGYSAIALARVDLPANTSVVNAGNIVDLRKMPRRRSERVLRTLVGGANNDLVTAEPAYTDWPVSTVQLLAVPEWATKAIVRINLGAVAHLNADVTGRLRVNFAHTVSADTGYDLNYSGTPSRHDFLIAGEFTIAPEDRGTNQAVRVQGNRTGGTGLLRWDYVTTATVDVDFREDVV